MILFKMEIKIKCIGDVASDEEGNEFKLYELRYSHRDTEKFLTENAKTISPQKIKPFGPWFEDGIITSPSASSVYFLEGCLVENIWHPAINIFDSRMGHEIKMGGLSKEAESIEAKIRKELYLGLKYPYREEKVYQTSQNLDLSAFSSILDLEKELSIPEEIKRPDNLFEKTKNLEIIGERLSGEPEILHEIEEDFRNTEQIPIVREQIKRILQYVPGVFPEGWKSPEGFDKLSELEKKAYTDIRKKGLFQIPGPIIQKTIELAVEYRTKCKK